MSAVAVATLFAAVPTAAQTYYARQRMSVPKQVAGGTPKPVAHCGALVKGDWFVDYQFDTGLRAATLSEAQAACDSYASKGAGTCGWTNDTFYPASFRNKVYWTAMVETRQYNIPSNTEGFVWAVKCPAG